MLCRRLFRSLVGVGGFEWGAFGGVHIRCCGNGHLGFRSYSGSLLANARNAGPAKSNQKVFAPPLGASLRLGMPALRHGSAGRRDGPSMARRG